MRDVHWSAALAESYREHGKPKQRHIAYLGGITESAMEILHQRVWFWEEIYNSLGQLSNRVSADEHAKIIEKIAQKVERPTEAEVHQCKAKAAEWRTIDS